MGSGGFKFLQLDVDGSIATITLNRPDKLNALNADLTRELYCSLSSISLNASVRALILTGNGPGFCSGLDINDHLTSLQNDRHPTDNQDQQDLTELGLVIRAMPQPVIAAINGIAAGAGLAIALSCDIRIASENARFSCIFVKRSLVPDGGASYNLTRLVGHGTAMEMALTGNIYDAQWALSKGLINKMVTTDNLISEAKSIASDIASNPPISVRSTKQLIYGHDQDMVDILSAEKTANIPALGSNDMLEATLSFLDKRPPEFTGS